MRIAAILCTWEAIESFNSGDVDAAIAGLCGGLAATEAYLPDPQYRIFHKNAEVLILCRCQDHTHSFPINRDGQPRFIAVRENLYREETIVHQARTPFNSRLLDKEENEREQRLVKSVFAGDQIRRGFKNALKSPID